MKNQVCPGIQQVNALGQRNYCLRQIFIQSIDELIIFDISKAIPLTYLVLSSSVKTPYPIFWTQDNYVQFPFSTGFTMYDDGYSYIVSIDIAYKV